MTIGKYRDKSKYCQEMLFPFKICLPINAWFGNFNFKTISLLDKLNPKDMGRRFQNI
jgi:hypothetical protein